MHSLNFTGQNDKFIMDRMKQVMAHKGCAVKLCLMQVKARWKFMVEQSGWCEWLGELSS